MKKIGLYFGSFNPIHVGHLVIANHLANYSDLDEVWMVVSPHNPFKKKSSLLDARNRLDLVYRAIEDNPKLKTCDIEFHMPQPSYTIDTLIYLKEKHPKKEFCLLMGSDILDSFHNWKNYEQILNNHQIYIYPRIKSSGEAYKNNPKITWVDAPVMEISSSQIRKAIAEKKSVKYLLPDTIHDYVEEMNFYR